MTRLYGLQITKHGLRRTEIQVEFEMQEIELEMIRRSILEWKSLLLSVRQGSLLDINNRSQTR